MAAVPDEREDGAFGRLMQGPPVLLPGADKDKRKRKKDSQDSGDKKLQGKGKWSFRGAVPRTGAGSGSGSGGRFFCSDPGESPKKDLLGFGPVKKRFVESVGVTSGLQPVAVKKNILLCMFFLWREQFFVNHST